MGSTDFSGVTSDDLGNDPKCRPVYFIVARGSMEPGNVVGCNQAQHSSFNLGRATFNLTRVLLSDRNCAKVSAPSTRIKSVVRASAHGI